MLYALASALFGFLDTLAGAAAEGYLDEQQQHARDWDTTRRRLITLLVQPDPPGEAAMQAAADAARWPLPEHGRGDQRRRHRRRTPGPGGRQRRTIAAVIDDATRLVVPVAVHRRAGSPTWRAALAGRRAALGPAVPLGAARTSYRLSRRALQLQQQGRCRATGCCAATTTWSTLMAAWEPGLGGPADRPPPGTAGRPEPGANAR